ncbi:DDE-type integrase/transposase/recombinase [Pseudoxanthomonas sp. JBR18]|uniref:Mu transposase C-terminal domain-containing protein n=1 Tax=Pseudoxanthomonas sp. JBR18 TaxID=2969308 RepID=UPI0023059D3D|nr:DDE-type integrase/transposase/recombinase [Pseudoxanthomonas sp. JBR18]WCE03885.1 DDE-type integrase/transposase/recombinase [Pseudoxanthomonas sp. JBR18]
MIEPFRSPTPQKSIRAPSDSDPEKEREATKWYEALVSLLEKSTGTVKLADCVEVASQMGVHPRTVRRRLRAHRENPMPASQLASTPGPTPGSRRLAPIVESLIDSAINEVYLARERRSFMSVVRRAEELAREAGVRAPSRKAVRVRIASQEPMHIAKARLGRHDAHALQAPSISGLKVSRSLEAVQIDHALIDLIVVSAVTRKPIGRPWITVAIDVYTRCILGYYLSFDVPNQTSVAHALEHASFPKQSWLKRLGLDVTYPMFGKIECIHWDNAKTFQAKDVKAQCERYGIRIQERPVKSPHYGAYVERVIGTMMGAVHLLPGTTFSNVKARGSYQSEKRATMSFRDLERWLAEEVAGKYHNRPHKGLGGLTPAAAWDAAWRSADGHPIIPAMIGDARSFVTGFLPSALRKVSRAGIMIHGLQYWDPCLTPLINDHKDHRIHFSQRDLTKIYLQQGNGFLDVPLLDRSQGAFSLWELREARAELKAKGKLASEESELFESIRRQRGIQLQAESTSKAARRKIARTPALESESSVPEVDYTKVVTAFDWNDGLVK